MCKVANALHEVWTWRIRSFLPKHGSWQVEQPRRQYGHSYRRAMAMGKSKRRWIRKCRHVGLRKLCTVSWAPGSIEVQKMIISLCSPGWIESDLLEIHWKQKNFEDQTVLSCFSFDFSFPSVSTVVFPLPLMIREAPPETSNSGEAALFKALSKMSKMSSCLKMKQMEQKHFWHFRSVRSGFEKFERFTGCCNRSLWSGVSCVSCPSVKRQTCSQWPGCSRCSWFPR